MARGRGYERFWDMPFGGTSEKEHVPKGVASFVVAVLTFVCRVLFRHRVDHREKLYGFDGVSGAVVVANHTSFLDVVFLYLSIRPRIWPRMVAKDGLFDDTPAIFGWLLAHVGAFPIKRDSADRTAIKRAVRALKNNEVICIMPEGTRRGKSDRAPEVHGGAALIARMGSVPIVPATVRNAENIKQKGRFLRFPQVTCEFGNPILVSDFDFLPKDDRLEGCMWYAMRECFALSQRVPAEEIDMVALFPEGRDFTATFWEHPVPHHTTEELAAAARERNERRAARKEA